jgi:RNA polymerase-binding protein DksA
MATKRKPATSGPRAHKPTKKAAPIKATGKKPVRPPAKSKPQAKVVASKPSKTIATKAPMPKAPMPKAPMPKAPMPKVTMPKVVQGKAVATGKAVTAAPKPVKGAGKLPKPPKPPAPVRPIGALPPEAVARAIQKAPAMPIRTSGRPAARPTREVSSEGAGVTEKDYQEFEQRLLAERAKILKEMGHLENTVLKVNQRDSAGDLSGYSFHMADVGTDAMEREKAFMFASNEGALLREIDEALRKIYRGEYGVCENCGGPIARARLEAMPYARLCLSCKENEERASRGAP